MEHVFPVTFSILKDLLGPRSEQFWQELEQLEIHQVPMCLRAENLPIGVSEIAHYESLKFFVENEDQGKAKAHPSGVTLNPSVQWVQISEAATFLKKQPGLYLLWKTDRGLQEMSITEKQAHLLDQLMDDMLPQFSKEDQNQLQQFDELGIVSRG